MTLDEMLTAILNAARSAIEPALVSANLEAIEDYLPEPPKDAHKKQFCVCNGEAENTTNAVKYGFIALVQLPEITNVAPYLSVIWDVVPRALDPAIIGMVDLEIKAIPFNPGEDPDHPSAAFIYLIIDFSKSLDDARDDEE